MNGIEYKCPFCGYETEYDYENGYDRIKGDEDFVRIKSGLSNSSFPTDINSDGFGYNEGEKVMLIGCPKCKVVSFQLCWS